MVRVTLAERKISARKLLAVVEKPAYLAMLQHAPSRATLERAAEVLDDEDLKMIATSDLYWDIVAEVVPTEALPPPSSSGSPGRYTDRQAEARGPQRRGECRVRCRVEGWSGATGD
jgi:hypothetical protein